jgi:hypothetical protein
VGKYASWHTSHHGLVALFNELGVPMGPLVAADGRPTQLLLEWFDEIDNGTREAIGRLNDDGYRAMQANDMDAAANLYEAVGDLERLQAEVLDPLGRRVAEGGAPAVADDVSGLSGQAPLGVSLRRGSRR